MLWNTPAALPPPNAGDLPVIKGKNLTVRQRLEQHRSVAFCASCHTKIDPLGLALENYDAIGAWRERQNGEGRKGGKNDPPIDASGVMPGGQAFQTLPEFKRVLLEEKAKFLKGFTEKLLAYALGRPVGAADQELVNGILTARGQGGIPFAGDSSGDRGHAGRFKPGDNRPAHHGRGSLTLNRKGNAMNILRRNWMMDRRTFLRGAGAAIALPWLEAMGVHSTSYSKAGELAAGEIPARTVFTFWGMGMNPFTATPEQTGLDYVLPESVKPLEPFRKETTFFTGLHAVIGGHSSSHCFLTGVDPHKGKYGTSCDQLIAERQEGKTRFPSLVLSCTRQTGFGGTGRRHAFLDPQPHAGRPGRSAASGVRPAVPAR